MVTRRVFLIASAGVVTAYGGATTAISAHGKTPCAGAVYGRTGKKGIPAGTSSAPSQAEVVLLDGTLLQAAHTSGHIRPNRSVLLSPDALGGWSVLYAEL
jgi:hypothetical protein